MKSAPRGTARIILAKYDTTGALLWDDVEMPGGATAISGVKMRYYPYGQEVGTATANDVAKFGTYTRDASSGLDYAMNRYYQSTWGRFTSPDPYRASGGPADPGSWNRYAYVRGDPVNYYDPGGLLAFPSPSDASIGSTYQYCSYEAGAAGLMGGIGLSPFCGAILGGFTSNGPAVSSASDCQPGYGLVDTELPPTGRGYYTYGPSNHRYGTAGVIALIETIASIWNMQHPEIDLGIGDISLFGGGQSPRHTTGHRRGLEVDIRPLRNDGQRGSTNIHLDTYDREYTAQLVGLFSYLNAFIRQVRIIIFNDTSIANTTYMDGHDDHLHVGFTDWVSCNYDN